ncbi:hypothetical protein [Halobaculum rubrum]|uniref:hypothetical protein n=1 Tax=Halobaculum rubrum TaxID=2872158 RepID=UPI001CA3A798|nr:hypothetical protein [Halobaculum rubrum]QZX98380.1 hypothetical protein K6T25_08740 [Halobaculum rubrum]
MAATTTETGTIDQRDQIGIGTKALVAVLLAAGVVGHAALGIAALTFFTGVLPAVL